MNIETKTDLALLIGVLVSASLFIVIVAHVISF